jgi:hypothetical protein
MIAKESDSPARVPQVSSSRSGLANDPLSSDDILTGFYRPERSDWPERGSPETIVTNAREAYEQAGG